jgi:alpha-galactosidase
VEQGLDKLGYQYVNMDDCWSATTRDSSGQLQVHATLPAPRRRQPLNPTPAVQPDAHRFPHGMKQLADYVHSKGLKIGLYTCVGTLTCKYGRPGSFGHFDDDARTLAAWGIDFVKADNCHHAPNTDTRQLYTNFSRALNATGRPM